ncbi:MAG: hypothetical protein IJ368_10975 [Oscillospiraceae bacterium]|nr:hypothetical protein [Oscillospiraceae bacterium]
MEISIRKVYKGLDFDMQATPELETACKEFYAEMTQIENAETNVDTDKIMCLAEQVRDEAQFTGFVNGFNFARAILNGDEIKFKEE